MSRLLLVMLMTLLVSFTDAIAAPFRTTAQVVVGGDKLTKMVCSVPSTKVAQPDETKHTVKAAAIVSLFT